MDEEEKRIEQWMDNPIIPQWMTKYIQKPESSNVLHYDKTIDKYVYTSATGEVIHFDHTAEAYDDSRVDSKNTKLVGTFPDLKNDVIFGHITKDSRMLFFSTNDEDYENLLYKIYKGHHSEKVYENNSSDFFTSSRYISQHMLNWEIPDNVIHDYWLETHSHISKKAIITGQCHVWEVSTTFSEKITEIEVTHYETGNTIEEAIINLAAKIYGTYTWEGTLRK